MSYNHPTSTKAPIQEGHANLSNWIALAEEGIAIFPAGPDKKPLLMSWQTKATTDTDTIRAWLRRWPDAIPAMPTGDRNGLSVLDLDVRDDGRDGISAATDLGVQMSRAFTVRTPSGGLHLYYRHRDAGFSRSTNWFLNHQRVLRQFTSPARMPPGEAAALWTALLGFQQQALHLTERLESRRYRIADAIHQLLTALSPRRWFAKLRLTRRS